MSNKNQLNPLAATIGAALVAGSMASLANASVDTQANPFASVELSGGYLQLAETEGKCGEGKCGEGKCGEGKCGGEKAEEEGKCGEGKCGEGKCGGEPKDG